MRCSRVTGTAWGYHILCRSASSSSKATSALIRQSIQSLNKVICLEKQVTQIHLGLQSRALLQGQTFLLPLEDARGRGSDRAQQARREKTPACFQFSDCLLASSTVDPPYPASFSYHRRSALIGPPRSLPALYAATRSLRIWVLKNAGNESAEPAI